LSHGLVIPKKKVKKKKVLSLEGLTDESKDSAKGSLRHKGRSDREASTEHHGEDKEWLAAKMVHGEVAEDVGWNFLTGGECYFVQLLKLHDCSSCSFTRWR
jgi:hypothetical protein